MFDDFVQTFAPVGDRQPFDPKAVAGLEDQLPADLIAFWKQESWSSFAGGLLWLTRPGELDDVLTDWLDKEQSDARVFLRTAFGHLYFWLDGSAYSLDVQHGDLRVLSRDLEAVFSILTDPDVQAQTLRRQVFNEAAARVGKPERDEVFAFVPAIPIGGPGTADTVQRVKLREHLGVLAQMVVG